MLHSYANVFEFQLQQDYGHFTVATVDITEVPQDCNCINTARIWSVLPKLTNILSDSVSHRYKDLIKQNLIDFGFAGWMADFGEYTPMGATSKYADRSIHMKPLIIIWF